MDITVWYPALANAVEQPIIIGPPAAPLFRVGDAAPDAAPAPGRHPIILLSHGFGGSARIMGWLGIALARAGYVVISVDHPGNNAGDMTPAGSVVWWERPRDMIAALRAVEGDPRFRPMIDRGRIGAAGFSIGGMTALALAGARVDPENYDRYCSAHPDDGVCGRPAELEGAGKLMGRAEAVRSLGLEAAQRDAGRGTALPKLRAAFAIAPPTQELAPASLQTIRVPTTIVSGDRDHVVPPLNQGALAAQAIPNAKLVMIPGASHYSFLATCLGPAKGGRGVCNDAPEQRRAHAVVIAAAIDLFDRTVKRSPASPGARK